MSSLDTKQMAAIIEGMAKKIEAEKDYLTQLDNEIGDGDHGINLARGFEAVEKKLPSLAGGDIGALLKGVGMQLVSTVGGASGPLYGTAFMKAGMACKGLTELDGPAFVKAMEAAVDGIKMRFYEVPIYFYSDKVGLGNAIGKEFRASLAVTDENLANAVIKKLQSNKTE